MTARAGGGRVTRAGAIVLAAIAGIAWIVLFRVSAHAVAAMGVNAAGAVFIGDFAQPWRAQFNTDFTIHLLLVAAWMVWRSRSWIIGLLCGVLAINLGALFTIPYAALALYRARGDIRAALLGARG